MVFNYTTKFLIFDNSLHTVTTHSQQCHTVFHQFFSIIHNSIPNKHQRNSFLYDDNSHYVSLTYTAVHQLQVMQIFLCILLKFNILSSLNVMFQDSLTHQSHSQKFPTTILKGQQTFSRLIVKKVILIITWWLPKLWKDWWQWNKQHKQLTWRGLISRS
jgi:hypothetical protein